MSLKAQMSFNVKLQIAKILLKDNVGTDELLAKWSVCANDCHNCSVVILCKGEDFVLYR